MHRHHGKRRHRKKCKSGYKYFRSLFPKDCRKYLDGIKENADDLYCCLKKNLKCDKKDCGCSSKSYSCSSSCSSSSSSCSCSSY